MGRRRGAPPASRGTVPAGANTTPFTSFAAAASALRGNTHTNEAPTTWDTNGLQLLQKAIKRDASVRQNAVLSLVNHVRFLKSEKDKQTEDDEGIGLIWLRRWGEVFPRLVVDVKAGVRNAAANVMREIVKTFRNDVKIVLGKCLPFWLGMEGRSAKITFESSFPEDDMRLKVLNRFGKDIREFVQEKVDSEDSGDVVLGLRCARAYLSYGRDDDLIKWFCESDVLLRVLEKKKRKGASNITEGTKPVTLVAGETAGIRKGKKKKTQAKLDERLTTPLESRSPNTSELRLSVCDTVNILTSYLHESEEDLEDLKRLAALAKRIVSHRWPGWIDIVKGKLKNFVDFGVIMAAFEISMKSSDENPHTIALDLLRLCQSWSQGLHVLDILKDRVLHSSKCTLTEILVYTECLRFVLKNREKLEGVLEDPLFLAKNYVEPVSNALLVGDLLVIDINKGRGNFTVTGGQAVLSDSKPGGMIEDLYSKLAQGASQEEVSRPSVIRPLGAKHGAKKRPRSPLHQDLVIAYAIKELNVPSAGLVADLIVRQYKTKECFCDPYKCERLAFLIGRVGRHHFCVALCRQLIDELPADSSKTNKFVNMLSTLTFMPVALPITNKYSVLASWIISGISMLKGEHKEEKSQAKPLSELSSKEEKAREVNSSYAQLDNPSSGKKVEESNTENLIITLAGKVLATLAFGDSGRECVYAALESSASQLPLPLLAALVRFHGYNRQVKPRDGPVDDAERWKPLSHAVFTSAARRCMENFSYRNNMEFLKDLLSTPPLVELPDGFRNEVIARLDLLVSEKSIPPVCFVDVVKQLVLAEAAATSVSRHEDTDAAFEHLLIKLFVYLNDDEIYATSFDAMMDPYLIRRTSQQQIEFANRMLREMMNGVPESMNYKLGLRFGNRFNDYGLDKLTAPLFEAESMTTILQSPTRLLSTGRFLSGALFHCEMEKHFPPLDDFEQLRWIGVMFEILDRCVELLSKSSKRRIERLESDSAISSGLEKVKRYLKSHIEHGAAMLNWVFREHYFRVLSYLFGVSETLLSGAIGQIADTIGNQGDTLALSNAAVEAIVSYAGSVPNVALSSFLPIFKHALAYCNSQYKLDDRPLSLTALAMENYANEEQRKIEDDGKTLGVLGEILESLVRNFRTINPMMFLQITSSAVVSLPNLCSKLWKQKAVRCCHQLISGKKPSSDPFQTLRLARRLLGCGNNETFAQLLEMSFPLSVHLLLSHANASDRYLCSDSLPMDAAWIILASANHGIVSRNDCGVESGMSAKDSVYNLVWWFRERNPMVRKAVKTLILARAKVAFGDENVSTTIPVVFRDILEGRSKMLIEVENVDVNRTESERLSIMSQRVYFSTWFVLLLMVRLSLVFEKRGKMEEEEVGDDGGDGEREKEEEDVIPSFRDKVLTYVVEKSELFGQSIVNEFFDHCLDVIGAGILERRAAATAVESALVMLASDREKREESGISLLEESMRKVSVDERDGEAEEAGEAFAMALHILPLVARRWFDELKNREAANEIESFTRKFVSPLIIQEEILGVKEQYKDLGRTVDSEAVDTKGGTLRVGGNALVREVSARYLFSEVELQIRLELPPSFPLRRISVHAQEQIGIGEAQWRKTVLGMNTLLSQKNGSLAEAIDLWRRNLDKQFEGVDECPICYSVLHMSSASLPKRTCKTCRHRFHKECLFKWFTKSASSACPLCRSPFLGE